MLIIFFYEEISNEQVESKARSKNKYGLKMVVYDKINKEVVDTIWIIPNIPNLIRH